MASSSGSGASSGSATQLTNSGSEGDLQPVIMDQRKQKRMLSNRESARRSRLRKQKHLDDLTAQVARLRNENNQILTSYNVITHQYLAVESENSVLRTQMMELGHRLQSLNDILQHMNGGSAGGFVAEDTPPPPPPQAAMDGFFMNPWSFLSVNQPIVASADMFPY